MERGTKLRIGVTGHRWTEEPVSLRGRIRELLGRLMAQPAAGAGMVVVSPLAEGADRLVAEEALALGAEIECPLPLARADYERDFASPDSVAAFRRLLERATSVDEFGGDGSTPGGRNAAYAAAGARVVDRSDVLLTVWDGKPSRGEGGTAHIVAIALTAGRPVVWVHVDPPHDHRLLAGAAAPRDRTPLAAALESALG